MPLPIIEPIRPVLAKQVPRGREWLYEVKLDGFRGTLYVENSRAQFRSKTKRAMPRFKDLARELAASLDVEGAILDGEILVMHEGRPDFYALMRNDGAPSFAAFDLLWLDGHDLRPLPLWRRKRKLRALTTNGIVGYVEDSADPCLFDSTVAMDLEGIIAKRRSEPYGDETRWLKIKHADYSQAEGRRELFNRR